LQRWRSQNGIDDSVAAGSLAEATDTWFLFPPRSCEAATSQNDLFPGVHFLTSQEECRAITRHHLLVDGPVRTRLLFELLGSPLFRDLSILRSNCRGINELLRESWDGQQRKNERGLDERIQSRPRKI
jgi:hypothetical protein